MYIRNIIAEDLELNCTLFIYMENTACFKVSLVN